MPEPTRPRPGGRLPDPHPEPAELARRPSRQGDRRRVEGGHDRPVVGRAVAAATRVQGHRRVHHPGPVRRRADRPGAADDLVDRPVVVGIMFLVQLALVLVRRDGKTLGQLLLGTVQFGAVWLGYLGIASAAVTAASGLARGILRAMLHVDGFSALDLSRSMPRAISDATVATVLGVVGLLLRHPGRVLLPHRDVRPGGGDHHPGRHRADLRRRAGQRRRQDVVLENAALVHRGPADRPGRRVDHRPGRQDVAGGHRRARRQDGRRGRDGGGVAR